MNDFVSYIYHLQQYIERWLGSPKTMIALRYRLPWVVGAVAVLFLVVGLWKFISHLRRHRATHVRGSRLASRSGTWIKRLLTRPDNTALSIGGVRFPRELEPLHLLITGATGTGKSQTIHGLLDTLRARADRVIATDIGGEAMSRWWQEGDVILNPLDFRSAPWSPFAELEGPGDAERVAKCIIPDADGIEREWFVYSQALIAAVLRRLYEKGQATNEVLLRALTLAAPSVLKTLVHGLPAQALFHEGAEKMLSSVRGVVGSYLAPYSFLRKDDGPSAWSIRGWLRDGRGWLWLPYREDQAAALRPLLAAWLGEVVSATLSLSPDRERRAWLLLDEVASLGRVQGLSDALTKGRKYGLCAVLGLQSISQLRDAYGRDGAQTLLACLSSQLLLRSNDPETAEYASRHLGEREILRRATSRGTHSDTVTEHHQFERLVLASQIQGLPDRAGYLRLSGSEVIRRVRVAIVERAARTDAFRPRALTVSAPHSHALPHS